MVNRIRCAAIILAALGIGFVIGAISLFVFGNGIIDSAVKNGCELKPGTLSYKAWRDPPVPLHISFYVFDLTNTDFLNTTRTPVVKQRGPFVYKEVRTKYNVEEYNNGTISYQENRTYTFLRELSDEDESVTVTTMNIVYVALVNYLQTEDVPDVFRHTAGELLAYKEKPLMTRTVKEFLWGYEDSLLKTLKDAFPSMVPNDQVSVFYASISEAGLNTFLINNGVDVYNKDPDRIKKVGNIEGFNADTSVSYWSNEFANRINGTDSTIWHPGATKDDDVYIFSADICRSLHLKYRESHSNVYGIKNLRFVLPEKTFANIPENEGFCLKSAGRNKTHELQCLPSGLMSLRSCVKLSGGTVSIPLPIIASSPHFLDADASVQNAVQGLNPDEILHRSFMDVEPITGTVMNGSRRMQVNLNVVNDSSIDAITHLKSFVYPMIWLDEHAEIDKDSANEFRSSVTVPMTILDVMKYGLLCIGVVLFIIVIVLVIRNRRKENTEGPAFPPTMADETSPLLV